MQAPAGCGIYIKEGPLIAACRAFKVFPLRIPHLQQNHRSPIERESSLISPCHDQSRALTCVDLCYMNNHREPSIRHVIHYAVGGEEGRAFSRSFRDRSRVQTRHDRLENTFQTNGGGGPCIEIAFVE